jgi:hypothetical protein
MSRIEIGLRRDASPLREEGLEMGWVGYFEWIRIILYLG